MYVSVPSFADCKLADMMRAQPALGKVGLLYSLHGMAVFPYQTYSLVLYDCRCRTEVMPI
jgi:hypothetical protein